MNTEKTICLYCLRDRKGEHICPHCGTASDIVHYEYPLLKPGTILQEKYLLGRALGQGGFAVTYLALQINLERRVAIKEYLPADLAERSEITGTVTPRRNTSSDKDFHVYYEHGMKRFIEEGRNIVQCHHPAPHPNIVRVTDFFQANGTAYLVMDFVEGISLEDHLKRQPQCRVSPEKAVQIIMPILDGLRTVHQRGFFHRDIKPANIYLSHDGPVILLDFGSARIQSREETQTMTIMLTPGYAPPEQYSSKSAQGSWTDVYGCAATLYKCITGVEPVSAMDRLAGMALPRPSEVAGCTVSPALESVILRGLEPDRKNRPQTVEEFQKALTDSKAGITSGSPVKKRKTATSPRPGHSLKGIMALILVLLMLSLGMLISDYLYTNYNNRQQLAKTKSDVEEMLVRMDTQFLQSYAPDQYNALQKNLAEARSLELEDVISATVSFEKAKELYTNASIVAKQNQDAEIQLHTQQQEQELKTRYETARNAANMARNAVNKDEMHKYPYAENLWTAGETAFNRANQEKNHQPAIDGYLEAKDSFEKAAKEAEKARREEKEGLEQETIPSPESGAKLELAEIDSARKKIIEAGIHEYAPEEWENAEEAYRAAKNSPDARAIMRAKTRYIDFVTTADNNHNNYVRLTTGAARVTASVLKLRSGPSRNAAEEGAIEKNSRVSILDKPEHKAPWVLVRAANGLEGWVHSAYLIQDNAKDKAQIPPGQPESKEKTITSKEEAEDKREEAILAEAHLFAQGLWEEAETLFKSAQNESDFKSARNKYIEADKSATENEAIYDRLEIGNAKSTADELNVRESPSSESNSLTKVKKDQIISITNKPWDKRPWVEIVAYGIKGWVHSRHLTQVNVPEKNEEDANKTNAVVQETPPEIETPPELIVPEEEPVKTIPADTKSASTSMPSFYGFFECFADHRYVEGVVKHLEVFASPADSMFVWSVNGKEVLRGNGKNTFSYTLKPGNFHFRVILEHNGEAVPGQQQECQIQVESTKPSQMNIKAGSSVPFDAQHFKGYNKYTWYLDGENVSSETTWTHTFGKAGNYRVEIIAEQPQNYDSKGCAYQRQIIDVHVQ